MKSYFKRIIPKSHIGKSILLLMGGTASAQAITAVSIPIVTRLYTPEMLGVISVYLSFFNFWAALLTWRYENALLITENIEESHHVFRLGMVLIFFSASISSLLLLFFVDSGFLGFQVLPYWSPSILFFALLGFGWFLLYRAWLLRLRSAKIISIATVARSGTNATVRVVSGLLSGGVYGLFAAELFGSWSALGAVRKETLKLLDVPHPKWSFRKIKIAARRYKKFAQYEMPSTVVNQLAIALPVPMIGSLYGAQAAGWFGLARLLYAIPSKQIGKTVGDVFQMELGFCVRNENYKRGKELFFKFWVRLMVFAVVSFLVAYFLIPPLVPYVFGKEWTEMGMIVAHMAPWMSIALIVSSMSRALSVLQKQQWKLIYDIASLLVVLGAFFFTINQDFSLIEFVDCLAIGLSASYFIYFFVIYESVRRMA